MRRRIEALAALEPTLPDYNGTWVRRAFQILLYDLPGEQMEHGWLFLLGEVERLYRNAGQKPPQWLGMLRREPDDPQSVVCR
jgi:hypothetical protein